jgi:hypothetical protein
MKAMPTNSGPATAPQASSARVVTGGVVVIMARPSSGG